MRNYPNFEDKYDKEEIERLKAEQWQLDLLKLNPDYTYWGPYEDYMSDERGGWSDPVFIDTWKEFFDSWKLNELNELVNFYFQVTNNNKECIACEGTGYCPEGKKAYDEWYSFNNTEWEYIGRDKRYNKNAHCYNITQCEVDALWEAGRLWDFKEKPTPEQVNEWAKHRLGHDAINKSICIKAQLKSMGIDNTWCSYCDGHGHIYLDEKAHVSLILWFLHPRKGCSRGVEVKRIEQDELPEIFAYLQHAAERNQNRFSKVIKENEQCMMKSKA